MEAKRRASKVTTGRRERSNTKGGTARGDGDGDDVGVGGKRDPVKASLHGRLVTRRQRFSIIPGRKLRRSICAERTTERRDCHSTIRMREVFFGTRSAALILSGNVREARTEGHDVE